MTADPDWYWHQEINPAWTLRMSLGVPRLSGYLAPRVHLFDGVRTGCEQFRTLSCFRHPVITFHPPTRVPTCPACRHNYRRTPFATGPKILAEATARMVTHALTTRDPHVAAVTLRMLLADPVTEDTATLLASLTTTDTIPDTTERPTP